jgi:hypothetical protein
VRLNESVSQPIIALAASDLSYSEFHHPGNSPSVDPPEKLGISGCPGFELGLASFSENLQVHGMQERTKGSLPASYVKRRQFFEMQGSSTRS